MLQDGWASNPYVVEDASHERSHIVWFHLYEMPKKGKSMELESRLMVA
jgi:hypothetical protein